MSPNKIIREILIGPAEYRISKNPQEVLRVNRLATAVAIVVSDEATSLCGVAHIALPDQTVGRQSGDSDLKFVDAGLPVFIADLIQKGLNKETARAKIIGGAQLFNFGGGGANLLNIGTRNTITARTILTREGIKVEKTETGGNKPRTVLLEIAGCKVKVFFPGEEPRLL